MKGEIGKMKSDLAQTEIEAPYELPEGWKWCRLGDVADCLDGFRKPINATERADRTGNVPYYGATGQVGWIDDFLTNEELVLLGEDGAPFLDLIKEKAYLISGKAWVNNHAHILRSKYGEIGNRYLLNYLNIFNYSGYVNGTTRLKLTQGEMLKIPFPLPPTLAEQQRIVNCIESMFAKLDEAKEKAQNVVDGFETRKATILHKAFTGELTAKWRKENGVSDDSWVVKTIGEICLVKGGKRVPKGMSLIKEKNEHPYLKAGNLKFGTVIDKDMEYVPNDVFILIKNYTVNTGDVYITNVGACIGDCGIIPDYYHGASLTENAVKLTEMICINSYLAKQLSSNLVQTQIKSKIKSATLGKLSIDNIKQLKINFPILPEQVEIVRILDIIIEKENKAKQAAEAVLEQIDLLKKSILARAFRGEL